MKQLSPKKDEVLTIRVSREFKEWIRDEAARREMTMSKFIRLQLIENALPDNICSHKDAEGNATIVKGALNGESVFICSQCGEVMSAQITYEQVIESLHVIRSAIAFDNLSGEENSTVANDMLELRSRLRSNMILRQELDQFERRMKQLIYKRNPEYKPKIKNVRIATMRKAMVHD